MIFVNKARRREYHRPPTPRVYIMVSGRSATTNGNAPPRGASRIATTHMDAHRHMRLRKRKTSFAFERAPPGVSNNRAIEPPPTVFKKPQNVFV